MGVELLRLLEGHPDGGGVAFGNGLAPEHHDIDAAIGDAVGAQRPRDAHGGVLVAPWLHPRPDAFLQFADNLIGHALIHIASHCLFFHGCSVCGCCCKPASHAAMSGGAAVTGRKTRGWCGPEAE